MNLLHLKYAIEIEKTKSINKAAENLFMGQPNLSRAIKELETSLGVKIFTRTSKGMKPTAEGQEFLRGARQILAQVNRVENMFSEENILFQKFSLSAPRASYISYAFIQLCKEVDKEKKLEYYYQETNNHQTIHNVLENDFNLGIVRYRTLYEDNFKKFLADKYLEGEVITEFKYRVLVSVDSPLAKQGTVTREQLKNYIEIAHADPYVPSMPTYDLKKEELSNEFQRRIFVYERSSQYDLLGSMPYTFMWVSAMPKSWLVKYGLVEIPCADNDKEYKDLLIFKTGYKMTEVDDKFIFELVKIKREINS